MGKTDFHLSENYFFKKFHPRVNRRKFLVYLLVEILIFCLILFSGLVIYDRVTLEISKVEEMEHLQLAPFVFSRNIREIGEDLLLITQEDLVRTLVRDSSPEKIERLKKRFLFMSSMRKIYNQIRYIDNSGMELIRINRSGDQSYSVPVHDLQDKSNRYYYRQIMELERGDIYISRVDLNIEYGEEEKPYQPTVRFGIPLFSASNEIQGMIVLNFNVGLIIAEMNNHYSSKDSIQYAVVQSDGTYTFSFDGTSNFDNEVKFNTDFPEVWLKLKEKDQVQFENQKGFFSIQTFYLVRTLSDHLSDSSKEKINIIGPEGIAIDRGTSIVAWNQQRSYFQVTSFLSPRGIVLIIISQGIIALILWFIMRRRLIKDAFGLWMESFFQGIEINPTSIVLTDNDGNILYTNKKFLQLSGYKGEEVYKQNPRVLKSGEMPDKAYQELWNTISSGKSWSGEFHNKSKTGKLYWVHAYISPILNSAGKIMRYLGIQEDISLRKELTKKLEKQASTDSLTGLVNRRTFYELINIEIKRCERNSNLFSLLMLDIDYFKKINDTFGHNWGDEVLVHLSDLMRQFLRETDICARFGGEEFVMVLTETGLEDGIVLAERLRKKIESVTITTEKGDLHYTLSIGLVQWRQGEAIDDTLKAADALLYKAKNGGRNRIAYGE